MIVIALTTPLGRMRALGVEPAPNRSHAESQPATTQATDPEVEALLRDLGSDAWQARRRAEDALVAMGEEALPRLRTLLQGEPELEVRLRAESAAARIEEDRVTGPSPITLQIKDAAPQQVLAELSRQAFAPLKPTPEGLFDTGEWPTLTLELKRQPFWEAMRIVGSRLDLAPTIVNGEFRLARAGGSSWLAKPFLVSGPCAISPPTAYRERHGRVDPAGDIIVVATMVCAEPKLKVIRVDNIATIEEAIDDRGNRLEPEVRPGRSFSTSPIWTGMCRLRPGANPVDTIARLKGSYRLTVLSKSERMEIDNVLATSNVTREVEGVQVNVVDLKPRPGTGFDLRIVIRITGAGHSSTYNALAQSMQTHLQVLDGEGQALQQQGFQSSSHGGGEVTFTFHMERSRRPGDNRISTDPAKLLWIMPLGTKDLVVPFELKDVPLPK